MNDLRQQLAPSWSGVNIALMVLLFVIAWPLGLLMIAYIIWGKQINIDLSQPQTLSVFWSRIRSCWHSAMDTWHDRAKQPNSDSLDQIIAERTALRREREAFEAEKRDYKHNQTTDA